MRVYWHDQLGINENYYPITGSSSIGPGEISIDSVKGLQDELDSLRAENKELREWIRCGRY
jgi:hypothetical protein